MLWGHGTNLWEESRQVRHLCLDACIDLLALQKIDYTLCSLEYWEEQLGRFDLKLGSSSFGAAYYSKEISPPLKVFFEILGTRNPWWCNVVGTCCLSATRLQKIWLQVSHLAQSVVFPRSQTAVEPGNGETIMSIVRSLWTTAFKNKDKDST